PASASAHVVPAATWLAWQVPLPLQVSALSHALVLLLPQAAPAALFGWVQTPLLHWSLVHSLVSAVHAVPLALTVSAGQFELGGASAMSWLILAVCAPVDAFEPVAPAYACNTSALSEPALVVVRPAGVS